MAASDRSSNHAWVAPDIAVVVPTLNAGPRWAEWLQAFRAQTLQPRYALVIDSSSDDDTASLARQAGFEVCTIPRDEFDHGGTRQRGVEMAGAAEVIVFLSQDALPAHPEAIENLVRCFANPEVGAAYGRQLPYPDASPLERYARRFNYPPEGRVKRLADVPEYGFRVVFMSNAFAAYRRAALEKAGGFKPDLISMEDEYLAAKILMASYSIAYCAEAQVFHSHDYTIRQEFARYFDFGVFHAREPWIRREFGHAEGEGLRLLFRQLAFLSRESPFSIPSAVLRMLAKFAGFRLGAFERRLPVSLKRRLGMNKSYWNKSGIGDAGPAQDNASVSSRMNSHGN